MKTKPNFTVDTATRKAIDLARELLFSRHRTYITSLNTLKKTGTVRIVDLVDAECIEDNCDKVSLRCSQHSI